MAAWSKSSVRSAENGRTYRDSAAPMGAAMASVRTVETVARPSDGTPRIRRGIARTCTAGARRIQNGRWRISGDGRRPIDRGCASLSAGAMPKIHSGSWLIPKRNTPLPTGLHTTSITSSCDQSGMAAAPLRGLNWHHFQKRDGGCLLHLPSIESTQPRGTFVATSDSWLSRSMRSCRHGERHRLSRLRANGYIEKR